MIDSQDTKDLDERRDRFAFFAQIQTRWMDNDVYGHVNNVVYYSYFDTVINKYLIEQGGLDIHAGQVIGLAVETHCRFLRPLAFPQRVDAGLRVAHLGSSSVRYEIGLFADEKSEDEDQAQPAAIGWFVHVFVDRVSRRPQPISGTLRTALEKLRFRAKE
jgi:acyl-CoA thioester hydrolase